MSALPFRILPLAIALGLTTGPAAAQNAPQDSNVSTLTPVTVTGQLRTRSLDRGVAQEKIILERVPGGTNLV
ncbi:MAG: hypothetical protein GX772_12390, partial [Alcaligenaceae bacterium]|nr:hypothetical protein [Alcaligenaceae bacterium]